MTLGFPTLMIKILACIPIVRYKKISTICVKDTCLRISLAVFKGDILEILWQLTLYAMIDKSETSKRTKINKAEQQTVD
jgi:hypothetical protein